MRRIFELFCLGRSHSHCPWSADWLDTHSSLHNYEIQVYTQAAKNEIKVLYVVLYVVLYGQARVLCQFYYSYTEHKTVMLSTASTSSNFTCDTITLNKNKPFFLGIKHRDNTFRNNTWQHIFPLLLLCTKN